MDGAWRDNDWPFDIEQHMSSTRNQVSTVAPDSNTQGYANAARGFAQQSGNTIAALPYYTGDRTAQANPFETQTAGQDQYLAGQIPSAVQGYQGQAGLFGQGANYFDQNLQGGQYGQQALQQGVGQQGYGLDTIGQAGSLFGSGAYGLQQQAGAVNPYLSASQGLLDPSAIGALYGQQGQGQAAQNQINQYGQQAAQQGFHAAQGAFGQPDASAFYNPFQQNVLNAVNQQYGQVRDLTNRNISDRATAAGAFGGDREAVTRGAALAGIGRDQNAALSQLTYQGYNDAQNRAQQQQQFQSQAGQSLFGQGIGALGQQAQFGQNAQNQRVGLYGQGLSNLGQAGQNASSQLYNGGLDAGRFQAQFGQQNSGTLFGAGNNAASQFANYGAQGNSALAQLGLQGNAGINQYGQTLRGIQQGGYNANLAQSQEAVTRQQQALQSYLAALGAPSGQTTTTPLTTNYLSQGLGIAGVLGGALLGGPPGAGLGSKIGSIFGGGDKLTNFIR